MVCACQSRLDRAFLLRTLTPLTKSWSASSPPMVIPSTHVIVWPAGAGSRACRGAHIPNRSDRSQATRVAR